MCLGGPARDEMAVLARAIVQQLHDRIVGVREVRCDEEAGSAEKKVAAVAVKTKFGLAALCAGHLGGTEQHRPESGLHLRWHLWTGSSRNNGLPRTGNIHGFHEIEELAEPMALRSVVKAFLPMAARVPFKRRIRRTTSPSTAMISGVLKRLWQEAL